MNYQKWIGHFQANRANRPEPDWNSPVTISEAKRRALAWSLAEYQLGDGGGPCRLIARDAERYRATAEEIRRVTDLWFEEEGEHSRLLSGAVTRLNGTFVETTFAFRTFCRVRRLMGVQFEMLVLLVVEIVSTAYYRVIRRHAADQPIEAMCRLILRDEAGHIAFHRDRLRAVLPNGYSIAGRLYFYTLAYACSAFLWMGHGRSLRTLGSSRSELFRHVHAGTRAFLRSLGSRGGDLAKVPQGTRVPSGQLRPSRTGSTFSTAGQV